MLMLGGRLFDRNGRRVLGRPKKKWQLELAGEDFDDKGMAAPTESEERKPRCDVALPEEDAERERSRSRSRRRTSESPAASGASRARARGRSREYAWMDSADEASSDAEPRTIEAKNVETLSQMLRLSESLTARTTDLSPTELVDICAAAGRVKFYDPALFRDTLGPALARSFRDGLSSDGGDLLSVEGAINVLCTLATLNAAGALANVFELAAKALRHQGELLSTTQRRVLKDLYASIQRDDDVSFLRRETELRGSTRTGVTLEGLPMRVGVRICETYFKTGTCRAGGGCRWDHPDHLRVVFNSEGYPVRPWAAACPYYMAIGTCDFRKTCKWHHPDKRDRRGTAAGMAFTWIPKGGIC